MTPTRRTASALMGLAALCTLAALQGCAPLVMGGAMVGGVVLATDRRTTGTQVDDEGIELKAANRIRELATLGHVNVTSYNRKVLLTGEVSSQADRARVEAVVSAVENVQSLVNELAVAGNSSMTSRSNDTFLTTQVKASLVEAKGMNANAIKVVTERATVYLMGRVTEREAARATSLASAVPGVQKVVRMFEQISEEELARIEPRPAAK